MFAIAERTDFAGWLQAEMALRHVGKSQLAAFIGTSASTVGAWFTEGRMPSTDMCRKLATYLRLPIEDVLRRAGHLPPLDETAGAELHEERSPYDAEISSLSRALSPDDLALWVKLGRTMLTHEHEQDL